MLYEVGIPSLNADAIDKIHALGYQIGLLADQAEPSLFEGDYDDVIDVNFDYIDDEMAHIAVEAPEICGVLCSNERYLLAKAKICAYFDLPGPSVESVETALNKQRLHAALAQVDPSIAPQSTATTSEQELLAFAKRVGYPVILKPHLLTKTPLTTISNNDQELLQNYHHIRKQIFAFYNHYRIYEIPRVIAEEYLVGESYSIAAFVDRDGTAHYCSDITHLSTAEHRGIHDTYMYRRMMPARIGHDVADELHRASEKVLHALKFVSTAVRIEFIVDARGVRVVAVAPRTGGFRRRMYELSYNVDLLTQEIRVALGEIPHPHGELQAYTAAYKLYPEQEGMFVGLDGEFDEAACANCFVRPTKGQLVGPAKLGYEASALVVVSHSDFEVFRARCKQVEGVAVVVV